MGEQDPRPASDAAASGGAATPGGAAAPGGTDLGRRRFFRQLTSEMLQTAATVVGAASAIQRTTAEAAGALLDPAGSVERIGARAGLDPLTGTEPPVAVFRSAFRLDGDQVVLVDQRRLPGALVEFRCGSAIEVAHAIREAVIRGPGAVSIAAALGLALVGRTTRSQTTYGRRAAIRGSLNAMRNAAVQTYLALRTIDRMEARFVAFGDLTEDGEGLAAALRAEADAVVAETLAAHGRIAEHGLAALPAAGAPPDDRPLRVLTLGSTGVLAGGQFGTALGVLSAAMSAGRALEVTVAEGRPSLDGARLAAWELANLGIPVTVVADAAAPSRLARGEIDVVLVGAERVVANGDIVGVVGTYPVALAAARHGVPLLVCAPLAAVDLATADGAEVVPAERLGHELLKIGDLRIAPDGVAARVPVHDVTPAELVGGIVTEAGVLRPPYAPVLAEAVGAAAAAAGADPARAPSAKEPAAEGGAPEPVAVEGVA